jgi:hypothetical protein
MGALEFVADRQRKRAAAAVTEKKPDPKGGRKLLAVWAEPQVIRQVKIIAAEQTLKLQDLMAEALNDVFCKYGKEPIA